MSLSKYIRKRFAHLCYLFDSGLLNDDDNVIEFNKR